MDPHWVDRAEAREPGGVTMKLSITRTGRRRTLVTVATTAAAAVPFAFVTS